ncbi:MAG: family 20 glycosylhydrolase [Verrucomicrobiota bacterium]
MIRPLIILILSSAAALAQIVPAPKSIKVGKEATHTGDSILCLEAGFRPQVDAFQEALGKLGADGLEILDAAGGAKPVIAVAKDPKLEAEAYVIRSVGPTLQVTASTTAGISHATASLLQMVTVKDGKASWPQLAITDEPDFSYRSFMVDMGRNPHSPELLRKTVDMMWFYKANYLHLHLTDDQLFSWPSKAFPKLHDERSGWSLEDFVELEAYSQARGVTVIPEFEVPGHSGILRGRHPEAFGETPTDLAREPFARESIKKVIAEMCEVFKATPYLHIGGDEAFGVPQEYQRDLINELNDFIKEQGKRTIVWEGPHLGEGKNKVDEDVIHIPWRSIEFPAGQMLKAGYEIVAAPWEPFYIVDHYPQTMFTAVDLERIYAWNPKRFAHINHDFGTYAYREPHMTKTTKGILGFCMPWWEGREENMMPLCLPRLAAAAAASWNRKGEDDFAGYKKRFEETLPTLEGFSGIELPDVPFADPDTQKDNLAYRAEVTPSKGAEQPHFGPARITNGIPDKFDHFLGFPTKPEPLEIVIKFQKPGEVGRIVVYERAVGGSQEVYRLFASADGKRFEKIGETEMGSRGDKDHVVFTFDPREISHLKIETDGCEGLTFPSFSRISEVMAYEE